MLLDPAIPYAHDALRLIRRLIANIYNTPRLDDAQQQVLHNIVHIFFSTFRHALHARTTTAAAPACGPAHTARATPSHAHTHAQLASQQAHAHLHIPATGRSAVSRHPPAGVPGRVVAL